MLESVRVPGKGRTPTSIEKLFGWVLEKGPINVSTEKKKNPGEYQEKVESVRLSKNSTDEYRKVSNQCEYRKMVESGRVPGKSRIRASIEKLSWQLPKKGRVFVNTKKW